MMVTTMEQTLGAARLSLVCAFESSVYDRQQHQLATHLVQGSSIYVLCLLALY